MAQDPRVALVLFDLDGTLLHGVSSERRFAAHLLRRGMIGPQGLATYAAFALRYLPAYGRHVLKKDKAYLAGLERTQAEALARRFVSNELVSRLFPPALARLKQHLAAGDEVAILTGAPDFIAQPLAEHLGVGHVYATRCAVKDGRFTAAPPSSHPFGKEKLAAAEQACRDLGCRVSSAIAYADSSYDIPLLRAVGQAVAVQPDSRLRREALARGWEILDE